MRSTQELKNLTKTTKMEIKESVYPDMMEFKASCMS